MKLRRVCGEGSHYSISHTEDGMSLLRKIFPSGEADPMNICLFSTSGVHGTYQTIEEEESDPGTGVTFVLLNPRIIRVYYGIAHPETPEDFAFLKRLRQTSKDVVMNEIG